MFFKNKDTIMSQPSKLITSTRFGNFHCKMFIMIINILLDNYLVYLSRYSVWLSDLIHYTMLNFLGWEIFGKLNKEVFISLASVMVALLILAIALLGHLLCFHLFLSKSFLGNCNEFGCCYITH